MFRSSEQRRREIKRIEESIQSSTVTIQKAELSFDQQWRTVKRNVMNGIKQIEAGKKEVMMALHEGDNLIKRRGVPCQMSTPPTNTTTKYKKRPFSFEDDLIWKDMTTILQDQPMDRYKERYQTQWRYDSTMIHEMNHSFVIHDDLIWLTSLGIVDTLRIQEVISYYPRFNTFMIRLWDVNALVTPAAVEKLTFPQMLTCNYYLKLNGKEGLHQVERWLYPSQTQEVHLRHLADHELSQILNPFLDEWMKDKSNREGMRVDDPFFMDALYEHFKQEIPRLYLCPFEGVTISTMISIRLHSYRYLQKHFTIITQQTASDLEDDE
jgi:hypothetical protein